MYNDFHMCERPVDMTFNSAVEANVWLMALSDYASCDLRARVQSESALAFSVFFFYCLQLVIK